MEYFEAKRKFGRLLNSSSLSESDRRDAKNLSLNDKETVLSKVDSGYNFEDLVLDAINDHRSESRRRHDDGFTYDFDDDPSEDVWNDDSDDWGSSDWGSSDDSFGDIFDGDGGTSGGGGSDDSW